MSSFFGLEKAILAARAAYQAGFRGLALQTAVAIAGAESGFNPLATGDVDLQDQKWGPSAGLWQIRSLKPHYLSLDPYRDINHLYDPLFNAKAAWKISSGGSNFKPWSVYVNGRYQDFVSIASEAVKSIAQEPSGSSQPKDPENKKLILVILLIALVVVIYFNVK
jgi:hypothetical protein